MWLSVNMPTGSGKSSLFKYLVDITNQIRKESGCSDEEPQWFVGDSTFEKMGALMSEIRDASLGFMMSCPHFWRKLIYTGGRA